MLFSYLVLSISDKTSNYSYSVSYSVNHTIELVDGLVTAGLLKGNENITYTYNNKISDRLTVTLAFENTQMLNDCQIVVTQIGDGATTIEPKV